MSPAEFSGGCSLGNEEGKLLRQSGVRAKESLFFSTGPQRRDLPVTSCYLVLTADFRVGADGRNWEQVTDGADVQHDARYSPDGTMIVFCRAPSAEGPWKICIARLGDESMDFVEIPAEGSNLQPDWR
jgi:hypothetical protein